MKRVANWVPSYIKKAGAFRFFKGTAAAAAAKSLQSCLTLCDSKDCSPPSSSVIGILQARIVEWVAISFSNAWKRKVNIMLCYAKLLQSCLTLSDPMDCSLPGSSVHGIFQARIVEWVAISFSRDLPDPRIEPRSPALQADSLPTELWGNSKNR